MAKVNAVANRNSSEPDERDKAGDPVSASSWLKESLLWLVSKSPLAENKSPKRQADTELKLFSEGDWVVLETSLEDSVDMSTSAAAASSASEAHGGNSKQLLQDGQHGGNSSLNAISIRKRPSASGNRPHTTSASLGPRTNSVSSRSSVKSTTHNSIQKKAGGKVSSSKSNLESQDGGSSAGVSTITRCVSPSMSRNSSPAVVKAGGEGKTKGVGGVREVKGITPRTNSPSLSSGISLANGSSATRPLKKKGILITNNMDGVTPSLANHSGALSHPVSNGSTNMPHQVSHGNGHVAPNSSSRTLPVPAIVEPQESRTASAEKDEGSGLSAFEKVRDTLRINRPKKKKKGKKLAYSIVVDPSQISTPEINLHGGRYQDPFETSFAENGEPEKMVDHDFKPASIPHNKPEYCDHCGDMAWGLYRQVLKCARCNFISHRKCESKVVMACSSHLEQAILQHDKQVEDVERIAAREDRDDKGKDQPCSVPSALELSAPPTSTVPTPPSITTSTSTPPPPTLSSTSLSSTTPSIVTTASTAPNPQMVAEKIKLSRTIREYNRKTTPVHHIHIKSMHQVSDPNTIEYHGFVRVHMSVQRPIHVSTAITRTSWYRLMRPVKERSINDVDGYDIQTAFYLPLDTNRLVHIQNNTTTKELIQILLKKFCVTDNPKKFSLYEEYSGDCRRLFEEDRPLEISLDASVCHRNSKLVLRDNTYSTIQWDAFSAPELSNFIQILQREEELYVDKVTERFNMWGKCIQHALKEKCMEEQAKKTKKNVTSRFSNAKGRVSPRGRASPVPKPLQKKSGKQK